MPSAASPAAGAAPPRRVVVKLGTGVLTSGVGRLDSARIAGVAAEIAALRARGTEVIVVSSGAVGLGMGALGLERRPHELSRKQACAAIGQSRLMETWREAFAPHGITVAQVLLGWIPVERHEKDPQELKDGYRALIPVNRWGIPSDLDGSVVFLASDASSFVTGQTLHVNGGMTVF